VLDRTAWRHLLGVVGASLAASAAGLGVSAMTHAWGPVPRSVVILGAFGVVYGVSIIALKHPDAARLWKLPR
jgi:hypothetical protein